MKKIILLLLVPIIWSCNSKGTDTVTNSTDYNRFLAVDAAPTTSKYFELWDSKIKPDSMQLLSFGIVGGEYNRYFKATGDIRYLKKAEKALKKAIEIAAIGKSGYYRSLARNYISQHRFKEALQLADSARAIGGGVKATQGLLFDIHMELGNYSTSGNYLDSLKNMSDFGYLIRLAKWNDHKGDLDATIKFMEIAANKAETSKNKDLMLWSYTNLADYYGHAGRIRDSYRHYLKSLELDAQNAYAKKGIAWIVFSHEENPEEALRILDSVTEHYKAPDYYLLKSEIADYMGDDMESATNLDNYFKAVDMPEYGAMYNMHNAAVFLERTEQYERALELAKIEVDNRPTPETYGLLAYSFLKRGDKEKALSIVEEKIVGKTFEPGILYYAAEIYKASGLAAKTQELKNELLGASYELGPSMKESIAQL